MDINDQIESEPVVPEEEIEEPIVEPEEEEEDDDDDFEPEDEDEDEVEVEEPNNEPIE